MVDFRHLLPVCLACVVTMGVFSRAAVSGSLSGVVSSSTGVFIPAATIRLYSAPQGNLIREVHATSEGRFAVQNVLPGRYFVAAEANGYNRVLWGATDSRFLGRLIVVGESERVELAFVLGEAAAVSGLVTGKEGIPKRGVVVQVLGELSDGVTSPRQRTSSAITDDFGRYQINDIAPGLVTIVASPAQAGRPLDSGAREGGAARPETYLPVYYPGTHRLAESQAILINEGQVLSNINFHLAPQRTSSVAGLVLGAQAGSRISVLLSPSAKYSFVGNKTTSVAPDGSFVFADLPQGDYYVSALAGGEPTLFGAEQIVLGETPSHVTLNLTPLGDLEGHVTYERPLDATSAAPVQLVLRRVGRRPPNAETRSVSISQDGEFRLGQVAPGTYQVSFSKDDVVWDPRFFRLGELSMEAGPLELASGVQRYRLDIRVANSTARLLGTVQDLSTAERIGIVAFPTDSPVWLPSRIRTTRPDTKGRFVLEGLAPGRYAIAIIDPPCRAVGSDQSNQERLITGPVSEVAIATANSQIELKFTEQLQPIKLSCAWN